MADPRAVGTQFVRGVAMGAADVVPGVSGGTVALLLGVYEQLVGTIRDGSTALGRMSRGEVREGFGDLRRLDWWFLAPLVAGMLATITALAGVIQALLENSPRGVSRTVPGPGRRVGGGRCEDASRVEFAPGRVGNSGRGGPVRGARILRRAGG